MKPYPETPEGLVVEHDGPILRVRLDRPDRRNAITDPIVYALIDLVDAASSDEDVRVIHLSGSGDHWWGAWVMTYPDGLVYHCIDLIELRDGLVRRETMFWAPPFEAPEWRAPFVDRSDAPA